jgi:hypothetical protein
MDSADPRLPIEATEPTLQMDSTDPREPIESTESWDQSDHREPELLTLAASQHRCSAEKAASDDSAVDQPVAQRYQAGDLRRGRPRRQRRLEAGPADRF